MALTAKIPEELYEYDDADGLKEQYRKLASQHHPDKGGNVADFQLVKDLYELAVKKAESHSPWDTGSSVTWRGDDDRVFKLEYRWGKSFEIGRMMTGNQRVLYTIAPEFADLAKAAVDMAVSCRANAGPNDKLKEVNGWILPKVISSSKTTVMMEKDPDIIPLRAVLDAYGPFSAVHAAWVIGRLMHILCYLEWRGIVHGDISVDNLFVNLKNHSLHLYGGWWYARTKGTKFAALPPRSIRLSPPNIIKEKIAHKRLDFELVRHTAIEVLGAKSPTELRMRKDIPQGLTAFLSTPAAAPTATALYEEWEKARDAAFGPRKFAVFSYEPAKIFKEI